MRKLPSLDSVLASILVLKSVSLWFSILSSFKLNPPQAFLFTDKKGAFLIPAFDGNVKSVEQVSSLGCTIFNDSETLAQVMILTQSSLIFILHSLTLGLTCIVAILIKKIGASFKSRIRILAAVDAFASWTISALRVLSYSDIQQPCFTDRFDSPLFLWSILGTLQYQMILGLVLASFILLRSLLHYSNAKKLIMKSIAVDNDLLIIVNFISDAFEWIGFIVLVLVGSSQFLAGSLYCRYLRYIRNSTFDVFYGIDLTADAFLALAIFVTHIPRKRIVRNVGKIYEGIQLPERNDATSDI